MNKLHVKSAATFLSHNKLQRPFSCNMDIFCKFTRSQVILLILSGLAGIGVSMVTPIVRTSLDSSQLTVLNREVQAALLNKVHEERETARNYMTSLAPQMATCRAKLNTSLGACAPCVNVQCPNDYQNCQTLTVNVEAFGASVSSTSNNGHTKITVCSWKNNVQSCDIINTPTGFTLNGIHNNNNMVHILLRKAGSNTFTFHWPQQGAEHFNREMQRMNTEIQHVGSNLQNIGQAFQTNAARSMQKSMSGMGQQMQQWSNQLSQSLSNMFDGTWLQGRKKRSHSQECVVSISDVASCSTPRHQCTSCPSTVSKELMETACGKALVNQIEASEKSKEELEQMYTEFVSTNNILTQVEGSPASQMSPAFSNVVVAANIRGIPTTFPLPFNLDLANFKVAGSQMADQIWKEWTVSLSHLAQDPVVQL